MHGRASGASGAAGSVAWVYVGVCVRAWVAFERACACTRNTSWEAWSVGEPYGVLVGDLLEARRGPRASERIVGTTGAGGSFARGRGGWVRALSLALGIRPVR